MERFIGCKLNTPKALEYQLKALKITEEIGNKGGVGDCYNSMGIIYYYQSNYPKALEYYFKALKIREETGDQNDVGGCYGNIGNVYQDQANSSPQLSPKDRAELQAKALAYYFKAPKN